MTYDSAMAHLRALMQDPTFDVSKVQVGRRGEVPIGEQEGDELVGHMSDGTPVYMRVLVTFDVKPGRSPFGEVPR